MAGLSKMIGAGMVSSGGKSQRVAWTPLISSPRSISTSVPTMQTMLCRNIIARATSEKRAWACNLGGGS